MIKEGQLLAKMKKGC